MMNSQRLHILRRAMRQSAAALALAAASALVGCSSGGGLGNVLGSVLGGGAQQPSQVSGTIAGVDTRNQQIVLQQSNGQSVALLFDQQTQVTFQNQRYAVTSLERGDQITARIQSTNNGGYYTDLVQVDQPVAGSVTASTNGTANVQALQGYVRQVDRQNGLFAIDASNGVTLTVSLPYNVNRTDLNRFQNLRVGDQVRFYGVFLNNSRVELRQFY
jgi:hypothetical protein